MSIIRLGCKAYLAKDLIRFWFYAKLSRLNGKAGVTQLEVSSIVVFRQGIPRKEPNIIQ